MPPHPRADRVETLAGYSQADLGNGRHSVMYDASQASGSAYISVRGTYQACP
jgi:hypothetical protein